MTEISKLAAISGESGLFRVLTPLKNGVILERLDESKKRIVAGAQSKVSILSEISVYTTTADGSVPLEDVLKSAYTLFPGGLPVHPKSDAADLKEFLLSVLKEADLERVYTSDIKKLVGWYQILLSHAPEVLGAGSAEAESAGGAEAKPKKSRAKKA
jgi:hypothetical protein